MRREERSPLPTSTAATAAPAFQPKTRKLLVPPALPEPFVLMSTPKKSLPTMMLVGKEPAR